MKCNVSEEGDRDRETCVNMMTKIAKMYCSGAAGAASRRMIVNMAESRRGQVWTFYLEIIGDRV
eukprot:5277708-Pyramimonas_sp.AAC.1